LLIRDATGRSRRRRVAACAALTERRSRFPASSDTDV